MKNCFTGEIFEFNELDFDVVVHDEEVYLNNKNNIYKFNNLSPELFCSMKNEVGVKFLNDGMWVLNYEDSSSEYVDIFKRGNNYKSIDICLYTAAQYKNNIIAGVNIETDPEQFFLFDPVSGNKLTYEGDFSELVVDDEYIYVTNFNSKCVYCFNETLEVEWEKVITNAEYSVNNTPYILGDNLILFHDNKIVALDKKDGVQKWVVTLNGVPSSALVVKQDIYIVENANILIFDGHTGTLHNELLTGFTANSKDQNGLLNINRIKVAPCGNTIHALSPIDCELKIFDIISHEMINYFKIEQYIPSLTDELPKFTETTSFWNMVNSNALSANGLLVVTSEETSIKCGEVSIEARPKTTILASPSLSAKHEYNLYVDVDNIDDLLRYAAITIKELQYATGFIPVYELKKGPADKNHNGVICLIVNSDIHCDEMLDDVLNEFVENLTDYFSGTKSGNKKDNITVKYNLIPENEKTFHGDVIDWPAIRDLNYK